MTEHARAARGVARPDRSWPPNGIVTDIRNRFDEEDVL